MCNRSNNLGLWHYHGQDVEQDYALAFLWYRKAADQGNAPEQIYLGRAYEKGYGVPIDDGKAIEWYIKAAEQDDAWGLLFLARMYKCGQGVPKEDRRADELYVKAAAQGDEKAKKVLKEEKWKSFAQEECCPFNHREYLSRIFYLLE